MLSSKISVVIIIVAALAAQEVHAQGPADMARMAMTSSLGLGSKMKPLDSVLMSVWLWVKNITLFYLFLFLAAVGLIAATWLIRRYLKKRTASANADKSVPKEDVCVFDNQPIATETV